MAVPPEDRAKLLLGVGCLSVAVGVGALALFYLGTPYWIVEDDFGGPGFRIWWFGPGQGAALACMVGGVVLVAGGIVVLIARRCRAGSRLWRLLAVALATLAPCLVALVTWEMVSAKRAAHEWQQTHPGSRVLKPPF